jgi:hypothetical protein
LAYVLIIDPLSPYSRLWLQMQQQLISKKTSAAKRICLKVCFSKVSQPVGNGGTGCAARSKHQRAEVSGYLSHRTEFRAQNLMTDLMVFSCVPISV